MKVLLTRFHLNVNIIGFGRKIYNLEWQIISPKGGLGVSFICWLWFTDNCVRPTRVPGRLIEFPLYYHSTKRFHMSKGTKLKWSFMSPTTRHTDDHKSICRPHFLRACKHCLYQQRLVADFPKPEWSGYLSFTRGEEDIFLFEFWFACP